MKFCRGLSSSQHFFFKFLWNEKIFWAGYWDFVSYVKSSIPPGLDYHPRSMGTRDSCKQEWGFRLNSVFSVLFSLLKSTNDSSATTENGVPDPIITLAKLLRKTKLITYKFNASPLYASALHKELKKHKKPYITAVITCWNLIFYVLEWLQDAMEIVNAIFMKKSDFEMMLTTEEMDCIPDLLTLLKPLSDITINVSREDIPIINLVVPYTTPLIKEL